MAQVQRMSRLMLKTLRDDPADAETLSHKLLVRAGYVRRTAAGIWTWLPLGKKVLENVTRVVREEMDAIGAQEVLLPALLPKEPYEATGRWEEYGDLLFRLKDRKGAEYLLGPTHEEIFTQVVKDQCTSYKDLPVILYQIQTKYRDEARPRSGVLRGREFQMKDSYSFDTTDEGLAESYRAAPRGLHPRSSSGSASTTASSPPSPARWAARRPRSSWPPPRPARTPSSTARPATTRPTPRPSPSAVPPVDGSEHRPVEELDTPDTPTIETLAAHLGVPASATLKNLLVKVDGEIVAVGVPGDREVDLGKLGEHLAPAVVELVTAEDFDGPPRPGPRLRRPAGPGEGPLHRRPARRPRHRLDHRRQQGRTSTRRNVVCGRDFEVDDYLDVVVVEPGDPCPKCGTGLKLDRAIEIGHIFQLGRKYADAFQLDVLGQNGKPVRVTMGSYGIGVSRAVAALAEQTADEQGLCWPARDRPGRRPRRRRGQGPPDRAGPRRRREAAAPRACGCWSTTAPASRPGVKFTDAELIGVPTDPGRRPPLGRGRRRAQGPPHGRARGADGRRGDRPPHRAD